MFHLHSHAIFHDLFVAQGIPIHNTVHHFRRAVDYVLVRMSAAATNLSDVFSSCCTFEEFDLSSKPSCAGVYGVVEMCKPANNSTEPELCRVDLKMKTRQDFDENTESVEWFFNNTTDPDLMTSDMHATIPNDTYCSSHDMISVCCNSIQCTAAETSDETDEFDQCFEPTLQPNPNVKFKDKLQSATNNMFSLHGDKGSVASAGIGDSNLLSQHENPFKAKSAVKTDNSSGSSVLNSKLADILKRKAKPSKRGLLSSRHFRVSDDLDVNEDIMQNKIASVQKLLNSNKISKDTGNTVDRPKFTKDRRLPCERISSGQSHDFWENIQSLPKVTNEINCSQYFETPEFPSVEKCAVHHGKLTCFEGLGKCATNLSQDTLKFEQVNLPSPKQVSLFLFCDAL